MINILIVDDSKLARRRTIDTVSKLEVEHTIVAEAKDGIEALNKFNELKPNLVITDIEMPNMNGLELLKEIRKVAKYVNIIVVSSLASEQVKQSVKSDNFSDFVKKPIDKNLIKHILLKVEHTLLKGVNES